MKYCPFALPFLFSITAIAQTNEPAPPGDSIKLLSPVVIKGYESGRTLAETPAAVGLVSQADMNRYPPISLVPSVNTVPGVRMEERSPGSYRLNIRGSLLRSPFGVRNIKIYWNDLPFTDAGGNTYLNLVDPSSIGSIEVLKGPGGSLYGANTGGVVVLHGNELPFSSINDHQFRINLAGGSYETLGEQLNWKFSNARFSSSLSQSHQQSDGYRVNSRMRRDVLQWNGNTKLSAKNKLEWVALYSDLFYQTPGGLTLAQMNQDPRQARPPRQATPILPYLPGAVEQKAAIYNKTFFAGTTLTHAFNTRWSNSTSFAYSHTDFKNPFITNYEKRDESNISIRSKFVYATYVNQQDIRLIAGAEWQHGKADIDNFGNNKGNPDTVQYRDRLTVRQWFPFVQAEWQLKKKLLVQAGVSTNAYRYDYRQLTAADPSEKSKKFDEQFLPRIAAIYPVKNYLSLYASLSKGYSPATLAEIRASDGNVNTALQPEFGWNYEAGFRLQSPGKRFELEAAAYLFKLQQAIVRRNNSAGEEYFLNAGGTNQKGLELRGAWTIASGAGSVFALVKLWSAFTLNEFEFTNYIIGNANHSGKALTGVPRQVFVNGLDLGLQNGLYLHATYNHTSKLPLNDANDAWAPAYDLLQSKIGWKHKLGFGTIDIYLGIDNALDERYSLGNDINAIAGRYFNPAPARNYFGGLALEF